MKVTDKRDAIPVARLARDAKSNAQEMVDEPSEEATSEAVVDTSRRESRP
jgi:hypothetical protein